MACFEKACVIAQVYLQELEKVNGNLLEVLLCSSCNLGWGQDHLRIPANVDTEEKKNVQCLSFMAEFGFDRNPASVNLHN